MLHASDCCQEDSLTYAGDGVRRRGPGDAPVGVRAPVPYFFVTTNGTPVGADEIRKVFKRVLQAAGLPRHFTPHCLRPTYASLFLQEDGGRLLYVSRQLGHANVTITADTYAKWIRPVGRGVVNALAISSVV